MSHEGHGAHSSSPSPHGGELPKNGVILHIDPIAGIAGDMACAAFVGLGFPIESLRDRVKAVGVSGVDISIRNVTRHAISALQLDVHVTEPPPPRNFSEIMRLLSGCELDERVRLFATQTFRRIATVEGRIHGIPTEQVHFHEVGAVDSIVDIVGASAGLAWLEKTCGPVSLSLAPLPLASGFTRGAHGSIPLPAPATIELLEGLPTKDAQFSADQAPIELITPTGAALLATWSQILPTHFGWPDGAVARVGYGAGTSELKDRPNLVRFVLFEKPSATLVTDLQLLEANVDDATPEVIASVIESTLAAGALDAWASQIVMKKGRPAFSVSVLTRPEFATRLAHTLLVHSGSLGVRTTSVQRTERSRRFVTAHTPWGPVSVKIADGDGLAAVIHPEFDDCRRIARERGIAVREVIAAAIFEVSHHHAHGAKS